MRTFAIVGWSGSGKTRLMAALLPCLIGRGLRVSTVKHTEREVDLDQPGKDSFRHRQAGAAEVMLAGPGRWALIHEERGEAGPALANLIGRMAPVDLVLIEGFSHLDHPRLEVFRPGRGRPLLAAGDPAILAVATDEVTHPAFTGFDRPVLDLNDPAAIAGFVAAALCLEPTGASGRPGADPAGSPT